MFPAWFVFVVLASFLWACVNILDKYILEKLVKNPFLPVLLLGFLGLISAVGITLVHGIHLFSVANMAWSLLAGICYALMTLFYFHAVQQEDISRVVPLFYLTPLFILCIAYLYIGETLGLRQYIGVFVLIAGAILLTGDRGAHFRFTNPFWSMIAASLMLAVNQVITKHLLDTATVWDVFAYIRYGEFLALVPFYFSHAPALAGLFSRAKGKAVRVTSLNEILNIGGIFFMTLATSTGPITLVNALSSLQPFFVLCLAIVVSVWYPTVLREEIQRGTIVYKFAAILCMFIGVYFVS